MNDEETCMGLLEACATNQTNLVAQYLRKGADPNYQHPDCSTSPFFVAIRAGHWHCAQLLMAAGASTTEIETCTGLTPLQLALQRRDHAIVDRLLSRVSPQERKKDGLKTILVAGWMGHKVLQSLAATGHFVIVDDEQIEPSMIQEIQVATGNAKIQLSNMMSKELVNVTDLILREVEVGSLLEYLAGYYPSMPDVERIIVITSQSTPSAQLSWLLLHNNKATALVVPSWWDTLLDMNWLTKWQATILAMLTTKELLPGTLYNYRRQTVATVVLVSPAATTARENQYILETELWKAKYKSLMAMTAKIPDKSLNRQFQPRIQSFSKSGRPQVKKQKRGTIVPWFAACHA
ncbi:hypothetical protein MHU86_13989 [Fragilaria crotonensis]|nr:hypothetical protein MHU86_13989 [Fragilaria crotonensis]